MVHLIIGLTATTIIMIVILIRIYRHSLISNRQALHFIKSDKSEEVQIKLDQLVESLNIESFEPVMKISKPEWLAQNETPFKQYKSTVSVIIESKRSTKLKLVAKGTTLLTDKSITVESENKSGKKRYLYKYLGKDFKVLPHLGSVHLSTTYKNQTLVFDLSEKNLDCVAMIIKFIGIVEHT